MSSKPPTSLVDYMARAQVQAQRCADTSALIESLDSLEGSAHVEAVAKITELIAEMAAEAKIFDAYLVSVGRPPLGVSPPDPRVLRGRLMYRVGHHSKRKRRR